MSQKKLNKVFEEMLNDKAKSILEGDGDLEQKASLKNKEKEEDKTPSEEADERLEDLDLSEMSNEGKLDLIREIIDAAQNLAEDESFDEFIENLKEVIDEFNVNSDSADEEDNEDEEEEDNETVEKMVKDVSDEKDEDEDEEKKSQDKKPKQKAKK